jgi:hypothetical protein
VVEHHLTHYSVLPATSTPEAAHQPVQDAAEASSAAARIERSVRWRSQFHSLAVLAVVSHTVAGPLFVRSSM